MNKELQEILAAAKDVAVRFKNLTGKPLGITGEMYALHKPHLPAGLLISNY